MLTEAVVRMIARMPGVLAAVCSTLTAMPVQARDLLPVSSASQSTFVFENVAIVEAGTGSVLRNRTVVVRDGRIDHIAPAGANDGVANAHVIAGAGKYLIPGLVDGHAHLATQRVLEGLIRRGEFTSKNGPLTLGAPHSYDRRILLQFLLNGVTTVVSFGSLAPGGGDDLELRGLIADGTLLGPRLIVGDLVDGATADHDREAPSTIDQPRTAEDGRRRVLRARQQGYDFIKPYTYLNQETYTAVVNAAHEVHLKAVGHLPELGCADCVTREAAFATPMDGIAHLEELGTYALPAGLDPRDAIVLADLVQQRGQSVVTTLVTKRNIVQMYASRAIPLPPATDLRYVDSLLLARWLGPKNRYLDESFRHQPNAAMIPASYDFERVLARELWKRHVPLVVGTDATIPGVAYGSSVPDEMMELSKVGLTAAEVLQAATQNAFRLLGRTDGSGTIAEGERADLVLLDANPLDDVANVRRIAGVMANGRWFSTTQLRQLADADARYFERLDRQLGLRRPPGKQ